MKGKQLVIVLILLVVVGGVALYLNNRNSATWSESASTSSGKILDFPLNDVSQITIKEGSSELSLVKKDNAWRVKERTDYPADFAKVGGLLRKLWELRPVQDVKIGPSQLARLQLTEPGKGSENGILLDLKGDGDKRLAALLVGKKYMRDQDPAAAAAGSFPVGRYVMALDGNNHAYLVSDLFDDAQGKPEGWISHDFIKIENPKSIALTGTTPTMNWKITRDTLTSATPWKLAEAKPGEELDTSKAAGVATIFNYGSFVDVLPPDAPGADTGLDKPAIVKIDTFDGFTYELRIGKLNGENYPVLVSVKADLPKERTAGADEKPEDKTKLDEEFKSKQKTLTEKLSKEQALPTRPFLIAKGPIDQVLKERSALMAEKKSSPAPSPAAMTAPGLKPPLKSPAATTHPATSPAKPK